MIHVKSFTFNPFEENTYLLYDSTSECIIIDPGCSTPEERKQLTDFINENALKPVKLLNTHCHVDHIFGNRFLADKFNLGLEIHRDDLVMLERAVEIGRMYGVNIEQQPAPVKFLNEEDTISFGSSTLNIIHAPGHSPGSIVFYNKEEKIAIAGDVLFYGSIGRTDLPGGDYDTLIKSIKEKLFPLGDDIKIYSGHGPSTTIGFEKKNNPFLIEV